jgi:hypothetical protein
VGLTIFYKGITPPELFLEKGKKVFSKTKLPIQKKSRAKARLY